MDINLLNLHELATKIKKRELSSYEVCKYYLDRIGQYDKKGPKINSILELNPQWEFLSRAKDREIELNKKVGALHGVPILLKDNIDTGDMMHTSAGSLALKDNYAQEDSFVAKKLKEAGAIILGKTNMTEWANFMTQNMPNGYSSRGGQVLNPYGPFDVGGSSSGSGAAVAAGFAPAAIGTETSGSIMNPCNQNSLVGIKPTVGLISRTGVIPIMFSQDTTGPMTKNLYDSAFLLNVLAGRDDKDPATWVAEGLIEEDYIKFINAEGLKGKKLGLVMQFQDRLNKERIKLYAKAKEDLIKAGAQVIEIEEIPGITKLRQRSWNAGQAMSYEFKPALNNYLKKLAPHLPVHSMEDVINYNQKHKESCLRYGQTQFITSDAKSASLSEKEYIEDRKEDLLFSQDLGIDWALKEYELDALVFPASTVSMLAARSGYPSISVPAGYLQNGKPFGISFTASAWQEGLLIEIASSYEAKTKHRKEPVLKS